jgi:FkbM family methyltransferase
MNPKQYAQTVKFLLSELSLDSALKIFLYPLVRGLLSPLNKGTREFVLGQFPFRIYEPAVTREIKKLKGKIFIDCGANEGYFAIIAAKNFEEVYAVEPEPRNVNYLRWLIRRRQITNVHIVQAAAAELDGVVSLRSPIYRYASATGGWSIESGFTWYRTPSQSERISTQRLLDVQAKTLASLAPAGTIDLVKVDVEGAEWRVLKGAEPIMTRIRRWIIELHDLSQRRQLCAYMETFGYESGWLDEYHGYFIKIDMKS